MKIRFDVERIYERLKVGNVSPKDLFYLEVSNSLREGESWKGRERIEPKSGTNLTYSSVTLPFPYKELATFFTREGETYSAQTMIKTDDDFRRQTEQEQKDIFGGLGKYLEGEISEFVSARSTGEGYFVKDGRVIALIDSNHGPPALLSYSVIIGSGGAERRPFTQEDFQTNLINLEQIANLVLNYGIDGAVRLGFASSNPCLELTF